MAFTAWIKCVLILLAAVNSGFSRAPDKGEHLQASNDGLQAQNGTGVNKQIEENGKQLNLESISGTDWENENKSLSTDQLNSIFKDNFRSERENELESSAQNIVFPDESKVTSTVSPLTASYNPKTQVGKYLTTTPNYWFGNYHRVSPTSSVFWPEKREDIVSSRNPNNPSSTPIRLSYSHGNEGSIRIFHPSFGYSYQHGTHLFHPSGWSFSLGISNPTRSRFKPDNQGSLNQIRSTFSSNDREKNTHLHFWPSSPWYANHNNIRPDSQNGDGPTSFDFRPRGYRYHRWSARRPNFPQESQTVHSDSNSQAEPGSLIDVRFGI